ncbi:hypothetical protein A3C26_01265 [Candidatus Daviesbacteria bacterium RIFCSPHIGHO2_02_FULL_39_12]|uniref:Mannosyl-glycoprotein endo-beta-N-acetylglucosamidase-like domain-containing protein n=2 Tax=Candidatus Daviesiibacteriota TaxID=1752718 RepID=A0A1F5JBP6_9BACT|nr:MAG: hypothetical protein A3C26_01265 [Candidatus Daviesbacteria bacterium RIFCSPHIGHO2_02_FULL_39_12]OGE72725.1 MAG: hypothetical protein A3H40_03180 [Candidatus Daviesbacteria bacterium RIFCSPLOWO2_02_FULL_38_15]
MVKKITSSILAFLLITSVAYADKAEAANENDTTEQIAARQLSREAQILASYLAKFNSPLQYHAQDFIDAAKTYELDWRLVPAIAGVESTFGKFIPGGYNAWGWGVYGSQAIFFNSWKDGIFTVAKGLKEDYISRGLLDPYAMNKRYAASPHWGGKVSFFIADIEKFVQEYNAQNPKKPISITPTVKIAADSATPGSN